MANKVLLKKSSVAAKVPLTTDLDYGELAINYADEKLYFKNSLNQVKSFTTSGAGGSAALDFQTYTASASQTTFSVSYTAPFVNVYVNGVRLSSADYTATSGSNVILSVACAAGDIVNLVGFTSLTIGYGLPTQTGNSGKYLTTDGTAVSWATVASGSTTNALTIGTGLSGTSFNGSTAVTIAIDSTVATLTGTQTLTNKTISGASNTLSNIGNSSLTNSSTTIGSTAIALGASSTTLAGLTSVTSTAFVGALTGNASTATTLQTARTINGVSFDGSANITVADSTKLALTGGTLTGALTINAPSEGTWTKPIAALVPTLGNSQNAQFTFGKALSNNNLVEYSYHHQTDGSASNYFTMGFYGGTNRVAIRTDGRVSIGQSYASPSFTYELNVNGTASATTFIGALTGNASTATTLQTARTINGVSFDGSANITITASSPNALTIGTGLSGTSFNGSSAVTVALASNYGDTLNPYASKTANFFLAAPNGTAGAPTFRAIVAADIPTLNQSTTGTASNVTGTVAIVNGGTGATTRQGAMDALAGAVTSGSYLRGNGTNVVMSTIQAGDVPTLNQNTTGSAGSVTNALTIGTGLSGTSYNGSSAVTIALASAYGDTINPYASKTANYVLASPDGTTGVPSFRALVSSDIPTLNQNTTGSAATLTTGRTISLTGDVTYTSGSFNGSANVTGTATLANSGATAGTYGSSTDIPQIVVDVKGRITSVSNVAVSIPSGSLTFTGDVSGSGSTGSSTALTLASVGTAGTYTKVTTDAKGRVTSGTTLSATDIPSLDASKITSGTIDSARLPSYVDDVIEGANLAAFPGTGETGKIYVALDTNKTYRWSGSAYVYITSGAVDSVGGYTGVVTATNLLDALKTVDGTGSGLDADLLDGNSAAAFYLATNPSGYTANTGTVTSVSGTGTVAGLSLSGTVTTSGNLTLGGTLSTPVSTINDSTTVGQNLVKLTNPSAISFLRVNADNTVSSLDAPTFRTAIGAGTSSTSGTVTSVGGTGTVSGLTLTGTVTSSGSLTLGGTLAVTASNFASQTANTFLAAPNGTAGTPTFRTIAAADIPTLNQNTTGTASNVTSTVAIANGGTGATTRQDAMDALAGAVTSGQYLRGNGTDVVMSAIQAGDVPTLNQNTTGSAGSVANTLTIGTGLSGTSYNGSSAVTIAIDSTVATLTGTQTLTNKTISGSSNTLSNIGNASLTNSSITVNGSAISLGGSATVTANTTNALTIGTGLSGTSFNGSSAVTIALASAYGDTANPYGSKSANNFLAAPNGTAGVPTFRAIVAADIPTLNQSTTGTAANVTGTVAVANGGTGATTAAAALTSLGAYAAANPSGYTSNTGTVTSIVAGTGLSGGTISTSGTIALANTAVTAGSYTNTNITVDAQGRITAASNGSGGGAEADTLATVTSRGATTATAVSITNATASTTTSTGALTVAGGVGIAGQLSVAGNLFSTGNGGATANTFTIGTIGDGSPGKAIVIQAGGSVDSFSGGALTLRSGDADETAGNVNITAGNGNNLNGSAVGGSILLQAGTGQGSAGNVRVTRTTASTSTTTGALTVAGGLGVAGTIYAGNIFSNGVQLAPASAGQSFITAMVFGGI